MCKWIGNWANSSYVIRWWGNEVNLARNGSFGRKEMNSLRWIRKLPENNFCDWKIMFHTSQGLFTILIEFIRKMFSHFLALKIYQESYFILFPTQITTSTSYATSESVRFQRFWLWWNLNFSIRRSKFSPRIQYSLFGELLFLDM